jgi:hypothetical protein
LRCGLFVATARPLHALQTDGGRLNRAAGDWRPLKGGKQRSWGPLRWTNNVAPSHDSSSTPTASSTPPLDVTGTWGSALLGPVSLQTFHGLDFCFQGTPGDCQSDATLATPAYPPTSFADDLAISAVPLPTHTQPDWNPCPSQGSPLTPGPG